jgi:hypothetical protein
MMDKKQVGTARIDGIVSEGGQALWTIHAKANFGRIY